MPPGKGYSKKSKKKVKVLNLVKLKKKKKKKVGVLNLVKIKKKVKKRNNPFWPGPDLRGAKFAKRRKKKK